jgi:hypothetical protein
MVELTAWAEGSILRKGHDFIESIVLSAFLLNIKMSMLNKGDFLLR